MIAAVVYFLWLEQEYIGRAGNYAQIAAFAAIGIDCYSSVNFCHIFCVFRVVLDSIHGICCRFSFAKVTKNSGITRFQP